MILCLVVCYRIHRVTNESVGRMMSVLEQGADGNDISMTNVPDIRLRYRHEVRAG